MTDFAFSDRIASLEGQIEEHAKTVERCHKAMLVGKLAGIAGAIWFVGMGIGALHFNGLAMIVSLSAMIGGFVMFGSSRSTSMQADAARQQAEAERRALIGSLELRTINERQVPSIAGSRMLH
jgi:hypothetical protein